MGMTSSEVLVVPKVLEIEKLPSRYDPPGKTFGGPLLTEIDSRLPTGDEHAPVHRGRYA